MNIGERSVLSISQGRKTTKRASSARMEALDLLNRFHHRFMPLHLLIKKHIYRPDLFSRDRHLMSELLFGTIRWQIQLDWILKQVVHGQFEKLPLVIQNLLRLSLYQLRFLDKTPSYAVVDEAVTLARNFRQLKYARMINGVLRNYVRNHKALHFPGKDEDDVTSLSVEYAYPKWMVELLIEQYSVEKTERCLHYLNERPHLTLRVNTKKIPVEEYLELLKQANIDYRQSKHIPEFVCCSESVRSVQEFPGYAEGFFLIQDESAGLVGHVACPQKGMNVADVCAAPGGKLSHLAQQMTETDRVIGLDISRPRLKLTMENVQRLGLRSISLVQGDAVQLPLKEMDLILIDAPCSGLGVIRKNPDIKLRRYPDDLTKSEQLQWQLLAESADRLKPGGTIVYSTCTINKQENEWLIEKFLEKYTAFEIESVSSVLSKKFVTPEGCVKTMPDQDHLDGSFCVRIRKGSVNGR